MKHLENTHKSFKDEDILVTIAMDGENAWEYYRNDGYDFLSLLYEHLSGSKFIKTTTIAEYLKAHPPKSKIERLSPGSWIYAEFSKWIGNPAKNRAWEYLLKAREELAQIERKNTLPKEKLSLAWKQMYVAEGSDWFWWYGDNQEDFDNLFRMHLSNFYRIIDKEVPEYLNKPITA
jgi:alpha-amylase/alpha-mannosidase (GH57 family)